MGTDIEEIKSRLNIIDVLGEYLRIDKAGSNYRALCPFHNEKSPSFMISEEKQIWHCFGCQKGGDIFGFVMEMEGLEFREALKILAEKAGVKLHGIDRKKTEQKDRALEILELSAKWYEYQLWSGPGKNKILSYLRERGLKEETIKKFRLGYAPEGWRNILSFLNKRNYRNEEIISTGLVVKKDGSADFYDRFRRRIMFPIADAMGHIVGYSARVAPGGDESQAKYINTPETGVYHKSRILYGLDMAKSHIKQNDFVLLVEGNMDVIAATQAGIKNTIAVSGTALTSEQVDMIKRYTSNVRMLFDMDEAGQTATKKSVKLCLERDIGVQIIELPFGKDAADVANFSPEKLRESVESSQEVMEYFLKKALKKYDKNNVEGKKKIAAELLEVIAYLANKVEKNHWIKKLSEAIAVSEQALTDMLKEANLKNRIMENSSVKVAGNSMFQGKKETLTREIIGLALIDSEAWKMVIESKNVFLSYIQNDLLNFMIQKGEAVGYNFDNLIKISENPHLREQAEKIFFQKKYRLNVNNGLEEISFGDPTSDLSRIKKEVEKEIKKERLEKIASDLKWAEEKKDQMATRFLRGELKKITDEISAFL